MGKYSNQKPEISIETTIYHLLLYANRPSSRARQGNHHYFIIVT